MQAFRVHEVSHFLSNSTLALRVLMLFISFSISLLFIFLLYIRMMFHNSGLRVDRRVGDWGLENRDFEF